VFIPYKVEIENQIRPVSNLLIIALTFMFFMAVNAGVSLSDSYVLDGFNTSLISHGFMHANWFHLLGNMYYLLLFGNAICSRVGNASFPSIYFLLIIFSGAVHLIIDDNPVIGASGAVNGVIGIYLFLFPTSTIRCRWTLIWLRGEAFSIKALWLIGLWLLQDLYGAINSEAAIAYVAHLGGLFGGLIAGWLMYRYNWIKRTDDEPNLTQLLKGH